MENHAYAQTVKEFLATDIKVWGSALKNHHFHLNNEEASAPQIRAWANCHKVLVEALSKVTQKQPKANAWTIVFEEELPRERGRRPDVLLLTHEQVLVLEFKDFARPLSAHFDQVAAYVRDLQHYHAASHHLKVHPLLVCTKSKGFYQKDGVWVVGPDVLSDVLLQLTRAEGPEQKLDAQAWLDADYAPLPTLVGAARRIFNHEPLPSIRRALSAGIPETIQSLVEIARQAKDKGEHHLALVTGVAGAGKTLVGLQFVYENHFDPTETAREAVFLSGNGPLVAVLQHALKNKIFVQGVHDFLKQYGANRNRLPTEHIWVYDEAQRAWDAEQVQNKRGHATSEPEDFLSLGQRMGDWAMLVGLIGEGQEIYIGEEGGLAQWNEAIRSTGGKWIVHAPAKIQDQFPDANQVVAHPALDLTKSIRSHLAEDLQQWVKQVLEGNLVEAKRQFAEISQQGFNVYLTRDLDKAKDYVRERYAGNLDKRYGLLASSRAYNLKKLDLDTWTKGIRPGKEGPWFNDEPTSLDSCCQLERVATEFQCQGLELDFPVVVWGTDFKWTLQGWQSSKPKVQAGRRAPSNPHQLRTNSYRVLMSRGRDGMVLCVPPETALDFTFEFLQNIGIPEL